MFHVEHTHSEREGGEKRIIVPRGTLPPKISEFGEREAESRV